MIDIIRLYEDYHIPYWTEGKNVSPGWVNIQCVNPFCTDSSNHLGFNLEKGYYNCWICGGHSIEFVLSRLLLIPKYQVENVLDRYGGLLRVHQIERKKKVSGVQEMKDIPGSLPLSKFHKQYLKKRGFNYKHLVEYYKIRGSSPKEYWNDVPFGLRIIIPIFYEGKIVSFQGRDITDKQTIRYKGCPVEKSVFNFKDLLYNFDNAQIGGKVIVVEGVPGVWKLGDGAVATFGTSITPRQVLLLSFFNEIIFLFDSEPSAQEKAIGCGRALAAIGKKVTIAHLLDEGKDPGDLTEDEVKQIKEEIRND